MIPALIVAGAAIIAGSGIMGYLVQNGKEKEAQEILDRAGANFNNLSLPQLREIVNEVLGPSAFEQIRATPEFRAAQIDALDKIKGIQEGGGFNLEDKANLNRVRGQVAQDNTARNEAVLENMQARGIAGGGSELAMKLANNQASSNMENQAGLDIAADARKRYFDAVREQAGMASNLRSQEFGEQSAMAAAKDARDQFNYGAKVANQRYNNEMHQQQFGNRLTLADRQYDVARDRATMLRSQGQRQGQAIAGVGGSVGGGLMGAGGGGMGGIPGMGGGGTQYQQPTGLDPRTTVSPPDYMNKTQPKKDEEDEEDYGYGY